MARTNLPLITTKVALYEGMARDLEIAAARHTETPLPGPMGAKIAQGLRERAAHYRALAAAESAQA